MGAFFLFPLLLLRGKWHKDFALRCGFLPKDWNLSFVGKQPIWIHAVSVGEVLTICGVVTQLKQRYPEKHIVCSVVTSTGYALARKRLGSLATIIYAPLDFSWVVKKYVAGIAPCIYIAAETEIWPNLYAAFSKRDIPIIQINGRISEKSFVNYKRLSFLFKATLKQVRLFCMQSERDAQRIKQLGALNESVCVLGNLKFDSSFGVQKNDDSVAALLKRKFSFFVAGSTHAGEEHLMCDLYRFLKKEQPSLRLVLVPRHIERVGDVIKVIEHNGLHAIKLSEPSLELINDQDVLVVDTIGKLTQLYAHATLVFIGKTFFVGGGQNMIEPAVFARPTIVGPRTENFKDVMQLFLDKQAMIQVNSIEELQKQAKWLLAHPEQATLMGEKAREVVLENQGASERTLKAIAAFID